MAHVTRLLALAIALILSISTGCYGRDPPPQLPAARNNQRLPDAAFNRDLNTVRRLVESGVNVDSPDSIGKTALYQAAANDDLPMVTFLVAHGADYVRPNYTYGRNALDSAAFHGSASVVQFLLAKGVDPNLASAGGLAPLHHACSNGFPDVVALLLAAGADPNAQTRLGLTPLHFSAFLKDTRRSEEDFVSIVRLMVKHGVRLDLHDREGFTPAQRARQLGYANVAAEMERASARKNSVGSAVRR